LIISSLGNDELPMELNPAERKNRIDTINGYVFILEAH
jgi:hypothetical protein